MKGAFLVSPAADLFDTTRAALRRGAEGQHGGSVAETDGSVQYTDPQGRLFTVDADAGPEFDYREGPFTAADPSQDMPDMATVTAVDISCRWEDLFARLCARIADDSPDPIWVLDGDGVIWPAGSVDPRRVRL